MLIIHHGSGVRGALADLMEGKTLVKPPYSDLKTDQVKELVEVYSQVWPQKNPLLIAGPLDEANPLTLDVLLKRIEEPFEGAPELLLWAHDLGSVPDTIRSRCGERFHYQPTGQHPLYSLGERFYSSIKSGSLPDLCSALRSTPKGEYRGVLEAYVEVLVDKEDLEGYDEGLKRLLKRPRMSQVALYGYFLEVSRKRAGER
jgi:hypothetical protein